MKISKLTFGGGIIYLTYKNRRGGDDNLKNVIKIILIICGIILGVFIVIGVVSVLFYKAHVVPLGETKTIKEENIEITVLSSEKITIEDSTGIALEYGDYIKVLVRIKNNGSSPYTWNNLMTLKLGGQYVGLFEHDDNRPNTIEAGKVEEGYLYFEYTDETIMNYFTSFEAVDGNTASVSKYFFEIR